MFTSKFSKLEVSVITWLLFSIASCGPGVGDLPIELVSNYYFSDAGGDQKLIIYRETDSQPGNNHIIVDSRVISVAHNSSFLAVLRQPLRSFQDESGGLNSVLLKKCEFYIINVKSHELLGPMNYAKAKMISEQFNLDLSGLELPVSSKTPMSCIQSMMSDLNGAKHQWDQADWVSFLVELEFGVYRRKLLFSYT